MLLITTDASTIGGVNGWAASIVNGNDELVVSGWLTGLTNNEAELFAIFMGLIHAPVPGSVLIWSDSRTALAWLWRYPRYQGIHAREINRAIWEVVRQSHLTITETVRLKGHSLNVLHNKVDKEANRQANLGFDCLR